MSVKHSIVIYHEINALIRRLYLQTIRRPSALLSGILQPLLWLVLFGALFQNAPISIFTNEIYQYNHFLSPGIIIFAAFNGSINAGLPLMFDREFGFLNRLLVAPLKSRDTILSASILFITTITMIQTCFIILCSSIILHNSYNYSEILYILLIILLISFSIASISICLAFILPGHIEFLAFTVIINLPILFSSTALAPLSFMPYWLQIIASINPLTYAIESIRSVVINSNLSTNYHLRINTMLWHTSFLNNIALLILFSILSFIITKNIISYKFE